MSISRSYIPSLGRCWDANHARKLYDKGRTDVEIAAACGISAETVRKWRLRNNLPVNTADKKKSQRSSLAQVVAEARAKGMTYGQYMAAMGR